MKSPNTSIRDRGPALSNVGGFSMIEIIVVLAIIGMIAAFGIIAGLDMYARYNKRSEIDNAIGLLAKARSMASNNIEESPYGVYFDDPNYIILFKGSTYSGSYYFRTEKNKTVAYDFSGCPSKQISFFQISGQSSGCQVKLNDIIVTINNEGGINF